MEKKEGTGKELIYHGRNHSLLNCDWLPFVVQPVLLQATCTHTAD